MIDDYFQRLLAAIAASPVLHSSEIVFDKRSPFVGYIRGDIAVINGGHFHFREFVNVQAGVDRYMYIYQYQSENGDLIFRYDNTPHYPDLSNYPHHKHLEKESAVVSADMQDLFSVIREIESLVSLRYG